MQDSEPRFARMLKAGEVVFQEGDLGDTMFVIRKGRVRITKRVRGGEKTFAVLGPGEFFGEMAILNGAPRSATATAADDITLLEVDARRFEGMVTKQAEIAVRFIQKLAHRLEDADQLIAILTKRDPRTRLILGLMREAETRGVPGQWKESIVIGRDLDDLSEELGISRAETDEVIGRLTRVGIARQVAAGLEVAGIERLNEFLSFLEERGIVQT